MRDKCNKTAQETILVLGNLQEPCFLFWELGDQQEGAADNCSDNKETTQILVWCQAFQGLLFQQVISLSLCS